ncbi:hypothetical protein ACET3Z_032454 [Daucus carota]
MARYHDLDAQMANLDIEEEENESFAFGEDVEETTNRGDNHLNEERQVIKESNSRRVVTAESRAIVTERSLAGFTTNSNVLYGLNEEENIGLKFNERKRIREDPSALGPRDVVMSPAFVGPQLKEHVSEVGISTGDLPASSSSVLAELAMQASRFQ